MDEPTFCFYGRLKEFHPFLPDTLFEQPEELQNTHSAADMALGRSRRSTLGNSTVLNSGLDSSVATCEMPSLPSLSDLAFKKHDIGGHAPRVIPGSPGHPRQPGSPAQPPPRHVMRPIQSVPAMPSRASRSASPPKDADCEALDRQHFGTDAKKKTVCVSPVPERHRSLSLADTPHLPGTAASCGSLSICVFVTALVPNHRQPAPPVGSPPTTESERETEVGAHDSSPMVLFIVPGSNPDSLDRGWVKPRAPNTPQDNSHPGFETDVETRPVLRWRVGHWPLGNPTHPPKYPSTTVGWCLHCCVH